MLSMVEYVHERIQAYAPFEVGVDFTMGRGQDTKVLLDHANEVYAFDIQEEALKDTSILINNDPRAKLILSSHDQFTDYLDNYDVGVFNLGYLPKGDHKITTNLETTKKAITLAVERMRKALLIVLYIGHEEGAREAKWVEEYASTLDRYSYNVSTYKMLNKPKAPYVIEIEKR